MNIYFNEDADAQSDSKQRNDTPVRVVCLRCCGSGKYSFNLMHGDRCFGCGGKGYVISTIGKEKAKAKRAEKKAEKLAKEAEERRTKEEEYKPIWEALVEKYKDDPRIDDSIKRDMQENRQFHDSVINTLAMVDQGVKGRNIPEHWLKRYYHDVPYARKDDAKAEGMVFDTFTRKWYSTDLAKSDKSVFKRINVVRE